MSNVTKEKGKAVIWVAAGILVAAGIVYFVFLRKKTAPSQVAFYANAIIGNPASGLVPSDYGGLVTFEQAFLAAWYNALQNNQAVFAYKGGTYNTSGGEAVAAATGAEQKTQAQTAQNSNSQIGGDSGYGYSM